MLLTLQKLILGIAPNVSEQYKWIRPVYSLDKDFCYLKTSKKHVTLSFFEFEKISTNKQLNEGTGKSMRHININSTDEIDAFQVKKILEEDIQ